MMELLKKKYGPAPMWVYLLTGVLALAWWMKFRQSKASATSDTSTSDTTAMPTAQPMNYSSDIFVNVPQTVPTTPGSTAGPPSKVRDLVRARLYNGVVNPVFPPARRTSVTTVARRGDGAGDAAYGALRGLPFEHSLITAQAQNSGYSGNEGVWVTPGTRMVSPS